MTNRKFRTSRVNLVAMAYTMAAELDLPVAEIARQLGATESRVDEFIVAGAATVVAREAAFLAWHRAWTIGALNLVIRNAQSRSSVSTVAAFAAQARLDELRGLPAKLKARYG